MTAPLGVLGGMGPAATADFYRRLVEATPAVRDQDHLPIVIWADPTVPDRSAAVLGRGPDPTPWLVRGAKALASVGVGTIAVPCNTAHAFLPAVRRHTRVPIVDMVDETVAHLSRHSGSGARAGLLATSGTLAAGLYRRRLALADIDVVVPDADGQRAVFTAISEIKAGRSLDHPRALLRQVGRQLEDHGAEVLIAACTEIPLALHAEDVGPPVVDPIGILVSALVRLNDAT